MAEKKKIKVSVRAIPDRGFARAKMRFAREAQVVEVDEKTLAILKAEKNLVVEEVKEAPAPEGDKTEGKKK
jgi:hypothetical protein